MLNACMKRIEITPPKDLELAGYPHYPRYNEGAHDPLYAACMYLENDGVEAVMVTLDLLFFSKQHAKAVREKVNSLCKIPKSSIMISCSHTHSAPWAAGRLDIESLEAGKEQPKEYVEELIDKITNLIVDAKNDAYPAYFTSGTAICGQESGIGGNRRIKGGPHDPLVSVMAIKDKTEKLTEKFHIISTKLYEQASQQAQQQAQQMLRAIQAKEKETQDKVDKEKAAALKSREKEKNW